MKEKQSRTVTYPFKVPNKGDGLPWCFEVNGVGRYYKREFECGQDMYHEVLSCMEREDPVTVIIKK